MTDDLLVVHVHVHVKADCVDAFRVASMDNASHSVEEPGVLRFDVVQDIADPTRFVLVEVYKDEAAPAAHKATAHYSRWRDAVEPMMAEPRQSRKYRACFPDVAGW